MAVDFPPTIRFSQLVRPPTMRSIYWRFFGFPATADGRIITRSKIVCTLCNGEVAYNRNTTNLKGHLKNRHHGVIEAAQQQEPFAKRVKYVYQPVDDDGEPLQTPVAAQRQCSSGSAAAHHHRPDGTPSTSADDEWEHDDEDDQLQEFVVLAEPPKKRRRNNGVRDAGGGVVVDDMDQLLADEHERLASAASADEDTTKFGYIVEYVKCKEEDEMDTADGPETDANLNESVNAGDLDDEDMFVTIAPADHQNPTALSSNATSNHSTTDRLIDVLVENMLPSDFVSSEAFAAFCAAIDDRYRLPSAEQIETALGRRYDNGRSAALGSLSTQLANIDDDDPNYFSIGVERWSNQSQQIYLTVYVFHVTADDVTGRNGRFETTTLHTLAWQRTHSADTWSTLFAPLPLANCTATLVNFTLTDHPVLQAFLDSHNIRSLFCLHHAIGVAARHCLDVVDERLVLPLSLAAGDPQDASSSACWHTRLDRLQAVQLQCLNNGGSDATVALYDIDAVLQLLEPLRVAEQTVIAERTPSASLVHPIVQQLLQNHFAPTQSEADVDGEPKAVAIETHIRRLVHETFVELGLVYHPVSLAASLLDPRFQNLIDGAQDLPAIRLELRKMNAGPADRLPEADTATNVRSETGTTAAPSKLSAFLQPRSRPDRPVPQRRSRLDVELDAYVVDVDAELEHCPLAWWRTIGRTSYGQLERCARRYLCVPAVLPRGRLSAEQQRRVDAQRVGLRGDAGQVARSVWLQDELRRRSAA